MLKKWKGVWLLLMICVISCIGMKSQAANADRFTLNVQGRYHFTKAAKMLPYVNKAREKKGLAKLELDAELTKAAMRRALECSVSFSHTRPDGTDCFSILKRQGEAGENIAAGSSSPSETFREWMNSESHRANILADRFQSIGIGCFEQKGKYYWVQIFSDGRKKSGSLPADQAVNGSVRVTGSSYNLEFCHENAVNVHEKTSLKTGDTLELKVVRWNGYTYCEFSADSFRWKSTNSKIVSVSQRGKIKAVRAGTAVITASPKSGSGKVASVKVTVRKQTNAQTVIKNVPAGKTLQVGAVWTVKPRLFPSESRQAITYTSSNKKAAVVDSKGRITAKAKGKAVITVKAGKTAVKCSIVVKGK